MNVERMANEISSHERRKEAQLQVCLNRDVEAVGLKTGFERYRFVHQALPEIDWQSIDLSTSLLGKRLRAPVIISPMTGGCGLAARINRHLAMAAQQLGIAMGVGSQRAAIVHPELTSTYRVREYAPDVLLLGNLGAVQLNAGFGLAECRQAVEMIEADGLYLHLNSMQEVFQGAGDRNYLGLQEKIGEVARNLGAPVAVKEVGWGISGETAEKLSSAGVAAIDIAGAGGTSWYLVERLSAGIPPEEVRRSPFASWGISTADSLRGTVRAVSSLPVIASGGIRNGVEAAKALAMGATIVGVALPLLRPATESAEAVIAWLESFLLELRTAMFCVGAANLHALRHTPHLVEVDTAHC